MCMVGNFGPSRCLVGPSIALDDVINLAKLREPRTRDVTCHCLIYQADTGDGSFERRCPSFLIRRTKFKSKKKGKKILFGRKNNENTLRGALPKKYCRKIFLY